MQVLLTMTPCRRLQFNLSDMFAVPRLGIGYLAAYLHAHTAHTAHQIDIVATGGWVNEISSNIRAHNVSLVGLGTTILSMREAGAIATHIKKHHPDCKVVVGGPGVGFDAQTLCDYLPDVDFFVRGEGEQALAALCNALDQGDTLDQVPNLIYRDLHTVVENPQGPNRDPNDGVFCSTGDQPKHKWRLHPPMGVYPPATIMETTRGCSFPCEFCCLRLSVRYRDVDNVIQEVQALKNQGYREIHFVDPTFTLNRKRTVALCTALKPFGMKFTCKTRTDLLDPELAKLMADAGFYYIAFGVESGDDAVLGNIDKKTDTQKTLAAFEACKRNKIRTAAYMLVGNTGDSDESVRRTIEFVRTMAPDYVLYGIVYPDPLNTLTIRSIEEGRFTHEDLANFYLSDQPSKFDTHTVGGHTTAQAQKWLEQAAGDFYVRPKYFWQRIRDLRSIQDAINLGTGGAQFFVDLFSRKKYWDRSAQI